MCVMPTLIRIPVLAAVLLALLGSRAAVRAQAPGVPIESALTIPEDDDLHDRAEAFLKSGKSLSVKQARRQIAKPRPEAITLAPLKTTPLAGREIARTARQAFVRLGWFGREAPDEENFFSLGAAYALTKDGVFATCYHVVDPEGIKSGCLVALRENGEILPVTRILAVDQTLDAAIVRIDVTGFEPLPLPLNTDIAPGDAAYCFSDPLDAYGYFSDGVVNRFYRMPAPESKSAPMASDAPALLRLNVGTEWAPGSSGAAVLDQCGNAIGHVAAIWSLSDDSAFELLEQAQPKEKAEPEGRAEPAGKAHPQEAKEPTPKAGEIPKEKNPHPESELADEAPGPVLITLHEAIPAAPVLKLIEEMKKPVPRPVQEGVTGGAPAAEFPNVRHAAVPRLLQRHRSLARIRRF